LPLRVRGDEMAREFSFAAARELFWQEVCAARSQALDGAAGLAAPVFEVTTSARAGADRIGGVLHGLYWLVANLADRSPLVLLVDDAHWLDAASLRFLGYLASRVGALPVLLAAAALGAAPADRPSRFSDSPQPPLRARPSATAPAEREEPGGRARSTELARERPGSPPTTCRASQGVRGSTPAS
jgi:hypothetical protein